MKITFLGAARGVTGSCHMIEACGKTFLVDCGMFQGTMEEQIQNYDTFSFDVDMIDFVILSHAHIDHSGRIPKLYKEGYRNPVYATKATCDLCSVMLPDSGHIQEMEIEWINRKRMRAGKSPQKPMYTVQEAIDSIMLFRPVEYEKYFSVTDNIMFRFLDAGHMLGSAIIEIWITENGKTEKIICTGDLGNVDNPIICNPQTVEEADYLLLESTYGDRIHPSVKDESKEFIDIILGTIRRGGNVVIPSFAVGRTQELLYRLNKYIDDKNSKIYNEELAKIPVVVDSPLATNATEIFKNNYDCYNQEALSYLLKGDDPIDFKSLTFTASADESRAVNFDLTPKIIISASGMCEAGRIKHHLKHNLWRKESTILFVGYQAEGTLGRRLIEHEKVVKIFGEEISVNADIKHLNAFSGHADQQQLVDWVGHIKKMPKKIFLIHGEIEAQNILQGVLESKYEAKVLIPNRGEEYVIGEYVTSGRNKHVMSTTSLKLNIHENLAYLKQDFDSMINTVKYDVSNDISEDELFNILGEIERLRMQVGKLKNKV